MTSLLDCQIFSWKVFLVKYLCWNFFLQIDSKWSKMWKKWLSVWPTGWTAQRTKFDWQPFFRLFITPNDPKCEKNQLPVLPTSWPARPSTRLNFYQWLFFYVLDYLELIWKQNFQPKFWPKKTFELLFDNRWHHHVQLILKFFWSKIFPKNDISNFLRSMSFLRSLSFFEIAVIFLNCCHFLKLISTLSLFQNPS